jgi:hypothetical protein
LRDKCLDKSSTNTATSMSRCHTNFVYEKLRPFVRVNVLERRRHAHDGAIIDSKYHQVPRICEKCLELRRDYLVVENIRRDMLQQFRVVGGQDLQDYVRVGHSFQVIRNSRENHGRRTEYRGNPEILFREQP